VSYNCTLVFFGSVDAVNLKVSEILPNAAPYTSLPSNKHRPAIKYKHNSNSTPSAVTHTTGKVQKNKSLQTYELLNSCTCHTRSLLTVGSQ
jgi:hypothetical protein